MKWIIALGVVGLLLVLFVAAGGVENGSGTSPQTPRSPTAAPPAQGSSDENALKNLKLN